MVKYVPEHFKIIVQILVHTFCGRKRLDDFQKPPYFVQIFLYRADGGWNPNKVKKINKAKYS